MNNKNRSTLGSVSSTAHSVKNVSSNEENNKGGFKGKKNSENYSPCSHCNSPHHSVERCLKKQNDDLQITIELLAKKVDAIGNAKMAYEEGSDYSDSMACSATLPSAHQVRGPVWTLDSACSNTLAPPSTPLTNIKSSDLTLRTANNSLIHAKTRGDANLPILGIESVNAHVINNLAEPLLLVANLTDLNLAVVFLKDKALIVNKSSDLENWCSDNNVVVGVGSRVNRSYYLEENRRASFCTAPTSSASFLTWHLRLSHLNLRSLKTLSRLGHILVSVDDSEAVTRCEDCIKGKLNRINLGSRVLHQVLRCLERVHSDLCQLPEKSRQGSRYMMTFVDEFTHLGIVYFLKCKSEAFACFKHHINYV